MKIEHRIGSDITPAAVFIAVRLLIMSAAAAAKQEESKSSRAYVCADKVRSDAIHDYGWGHLSDQAVAEIVSHSPIVEIFAGSGRVAADLRAKGSDVVCYDNMENWVTSWDKHESAKAVIRMDGIKAVARHPDRTLLMVWPPYKSTAATRVVSTYEGNCVLYVGEARGGCTADESLFDAFDAGWDLIKVVPVKQFLDIKDVLWVLTRKSGGGRKIPNQFLAKGQKAEPYHLTTSEMLAGLQKAAADDPMLQLAIMMSVMGAAQNKK